MVAAGIGFSAAFSQSTIEQPLDIGAVADTRK